jgi:hypothetical protein
LFAQLAALFLDRRYYYLHSQPHFSGSNLFTRHESRQLMWKMQTHVSKIQKMVINSGGQPVENYIIRNHRQQEWLFWQVCVVLSNQ